MDKKILLDGAHNLDSAKALRAAIEKNFAETRPVIIFGALGDKQWPEICRTLAPLAAKIFTVPVASERTMDAHALAAAFRPANPAAEVQACKNISEALIASKGAAFIVVTGSVVSGRGNLGIARPFAGKHRGTRLERMVSNAISHRQAHV